MLFRSLQNQNEGKPDEALKYYQLSIDDNTSAIRYRPNLARAYYNRSGNYYTLKKFDLALQDALKARELGMEVESAYLDVLEKELGKK